MAWNPCPEVAAARDFGNKFNAMQVVITYITRDGQIGYASYGANKKLCDVTKHLADHLNKAAIDWYSEDTAAQGMMDSMQT